MDPYIILSGQSKGVNRNKRNRYKSLILTIVRHEQLILVQGVDSKKGQLIYLTPKGSFQVILYKMIRFLSGKLKKHTKLAKIVKISIFVNRLVFPTDSVIPWHYYLLYPLSSKCTFTKVTCWFNLPSMIFNLPVGLFIWQRIKCINWPSLVLKCYYK